MTPASPSTVISIDHVIYRRSLFGYAGGMDVDASALKLRSLLRAALAQRYPQAEITIDIIDDTGDNTDCPLVLVDDGQGNRVEDDGTHYEADWIIQAIVEDTAAWQQRWTALGATDVKQMGDHWRPLEDDL